MCQICIYMLHLQWETIVIVCSIVNTNKLQELYVNNSEGGMLDFPFDICGLSCFYTPTSVYGTCSKQLVWMSINQAFIFCMHPLYFYEWPRFA